MEISVPGSERRQARSLVTGLRVGTSPGIREDDAGVALDAAEGRPLLIPLHDLRGILGVLSREIQLDQEELVLHSLLEGSMVEGFRASGPTTDPA